MKRAKTNAMRLLQGHKINYTAHTYQTDGAIDGVSVAEQTGQNPNQVFKTLVTIGRSGKYYVFCIPVNKQLDLKKAAKVAQEKNITMIPQSQLYELTGYVHGGCSPIGMKKLFDTFIDESATQFSTILVSGGCIGLQIEIEPLLLQPLIKAKFALLTL